MGFGERQFRPRVFGLLFSFCCAFAALAEENKRVEPVDEADRDLSLVEFRESMLLAVQRREPEQFVTMVDFNVYNGTRTRKGIKAFVEKWKPDALDTELWSVMEPILNMGGGFVRSERGVQFCAPYVFTHFPDQFDIFGYALLTRDDVELMSQPSSSSQQLAKLGFNVLKVIDWRRVPDANGTEDQFWLHVALPGGKQGYVIRDYMRSPSDYSVCFLQNRKGDWKLISLSAADD